MSDGLSLVVVGHLLVTRQPMLFATTMGSTTAPQLKVVNSMSPPEALILIVTPDLRFLMKISPVGLREMLISPSLCTVGNWPDMCWLVLVLLNYSTFIYFVNIRQTTAFRPYTRTPHVCACRLINQ